MRTEKDSLGEKAVPDDVYYGIQTLRAVENFPISGLRASLEFIDAFLQIKKAAAITNGQLGVLPGDVTKVLVQTCDELLANPKRLDHFPVDVFQMGAGTSLHMNVNEVLANRAGEILGSPKGSYKSVHPNDHVNLGQSTNDVFPSAMRIAALTILRDSFLPSLESLEKAIGQKADQFDSVLKSARTHLADAVPIRLGQEFAAYRQALKKAREAIIRASESLQELGLGGSAAGTGLNTHPQYRVMVISELSKQTGLSLKPASDMREAMQSQRPIAELSSSLRNLALEIGRISNDLRLLSSGPHTGLAEIQLPAKAPGSSIMPGKVNPSILEMMNMVCFQVIGCDTTIAHAVGAGQLELNVMMPVMAFNLFFSLKIMTNAMHAMTTHCIKDISADEVRCRAYAENSLGLATALNLSLGYSRAATIVQGAVKENISLVQYIRKHRILSDAEIEKIFDPRKMTEPGIPGK